MKLLSIIIPAYNMQNYIAKTLSSMIHPDIMDDLEVLIIDDGSKDDTAKISKVYETLYPNTFKVISKKNGGHGSALNCGIKYATGKYYRPIDADDWVDTDALVRFINELKRINADMVVTHFAKVFEKQNKVKVVRLEHVYSVGQVNRGEALKKERGKKICIYGKTYDFNNDLPEFGEFYLFHNITYRTKLLKDNKIKFDEHCFYDDMEYDFFPIPYVKTIAAVDVCLYMYRLERDGQSVENASFIKNRKQREQIVLNICKYFKEHKDKLRPNILKHVKRETVWRIIRQYDIYLSMPYRKSTKQEMIDFDMALKAIDIDLYNCATNKKIALFRKSKYHLFGLVHLIPRIYPYFIAPLKKARNNYRKKHRAKPWEVRSDYDMHFRIFGRRLLSLLHLGFMNKDMRELRKFKNIHKGERCFITCTGPSLRIEDLEMLKNEYTIGVNSITKAYAVTDWRPTYYALIDIFAFGSFLADHEVDGGKFCLEHSFLHYRANPKTRNGNESFCLIDYGNHTKSNMKHNRIRLSKDISVCIYDCFTVTIMAMQIAFYMGFKEVYIIGADCNYNMDQIHFIEMPDDKYKLSTGRLPHATELSICGYMAAKKYADKHGIKVYNATRGGKLEVFPRVDLDDVLDNKKEINK